MRPRVLPPSALLFFILITLITLITFAPPAWGQSAPPAEMPAWLAAPLIEDEPPLRLAEHSLAEPAAVLAEAALGAGDELDALRTRNASSRLPLQNGFVRPLPLSRPLVLDPASLDASLVGRHQGGVLARSGPDRWVWGTEVRVAGAHRLRLVLADVELPESARLWVYGDGGEARGPFGRELVHEGRLVTPSIAGEAVRLEVEVDATEARAPLRLTLDGVTELFELDADGAPRLGPVPKVIDPSCLLDASCIDDVVFPEIELTRRAIGQMTFNLGRSSYVCTGGLVNDRDESSFVPYFLTAHHCLATHGSAASLEVLWDAIPRRCGGTLPRRLPRSNGALLLATGAASDFTLLQLLAVPGGRGFLGWHAGAEAVRPGTVVHRISHPAPFGQALSQGYSRASIISSSRQGCVSPSRFLATTMHNGGVFGGSSGAPLVLPNGMLVGQLLGACGRSPDAAENGCDYSNTFLDGWFGTTFPAISGFLTGGGDGGIPDGPWLRSPGLPGFEAKVRINDAVAGKREADCIPQTLCISGALAGRPEIFVKAIGPRPNGYLWAQISRFTPSKVEIWLRQRSTGTIKRYELAAVPASSNDVSGLQDKEAFLP